MDGFQVPAGQKGGVLLRILDRDGFVRISKLHDVKSAILFAKTRKEVKEYERKAGKKSH